MIGSVFFLYCPFSGERLRQLLADLQAISADQADPRVLRRSAAARVRVARCRARTIGKRDGLSLCARRCIQR